jgi:uncharacterized OB-fold protein
MSERPLPKPNADTKPFWDGCKKQKLMFQKCGECGHVRWPPSVLCPLCHSLETEWIAASGRGTIYTFAVYHVPFHEAFKNRLPYVTAVVELDEGPRILSTITGCDIADIRCDMPVEVIWRTAPEGFVLPDFTPTSVTN